MLKRIISIASAVLLLLSCFRVDSYAMEIVSENEMPDYICIDALDVTIDTEAQEERTERSCYLCFNDDEDGDGIVQAFVEEDYLSAQNYTWNICTTIVVYRVGNQKYAVELTAYDNQVLITYYKSNIHWGDGTIYYNLTGSPNSTVVYPTYNAAFSYIIGPWYHTYSSSGTYTIQTSNVIVKICDLITPSVSVYATTYLDYWTENVY